MIPEKGLFGLDMHREDIVRILNTRGIKIVADESHGSAGSSIWSDDIHFIFDSEGKVREIYVSGKSFRTLNGLSIGDEIGRIKELYGEENSSHLEPGAIVYEYHFNLNYFFVAVDERSKVVGWGIANK